MKLIEDVQEKRSAQETFARQLTLAWGNRARRRVVWRPDRLDIDIVHNDEYWFAGVSISPPNRSPRYWNSLGVYHGAGSLQIAVEINVPQSSNEQTFSGFFGRDASTDAIYLLHDGAVGGGRTGVGKFAFLAWSRERLVSVSDSQDRVRLGILVTPIEHPSIGSLVAAFARKVVDFKQAVKNGQILGDRAFANQQRRYADYFREFSGKKKWTPRSKEIEYFSRHGDIVDALSRWRANDARPGERLVKNLLIDLGVEVSNRLAEVYEVKPTTERYALYTGIGQVLVHGSAASRLTRRFLVLPKAGTIPNDVRRALSSLKIGVLRFEIVGDLIRILK